METLEAELKKKLAEACVRVTLAESRLADFRAERTRDQADYAAAMKLANQRSHECAQLQEQMVAYRQQVRDLQESRWRKLGLRIGIAKRAAWERE